MTRAAELKQQIELERRGEPFLLFRTGDGEQRLYVLAPSASPVTVGRRTETTAEIIGGLAAGERVVTEGAYGLEDSVKVAQAK